MSEDIEGIEGIERPINPFAEVLNWKNREAARSFLSCVFIVVNDAQAPYREGTMSTGHAERGAINLANAIILATNNGSGKLANALEEILGVRLTMDVTKPEIHRSLPKKAAPSSLVFRQCAALLEVMNKEMREEKNMGRIEKIMRWARKNWVGEE